MIIIYLVAIVIANLTVTYFGEKAIYLNAFFLIGLDIVLRDKLHEKWNNDNLFVKMLFLIGSGSILSYLINQDAQIVAIASFSAFFLASIVDFVLYLYFADKKFLVKSNISNIGSSLTDSIVFPMILFGGLSLQITALQFLSKFFGGLFWSYIVNFISTKTHKN